MFITNSENLSAYEDIMEEAMYGKRGPIYCHITNVGLYTLVVKEDLSGGISPGVLVNKHSQWPPDFIKAKEMTPTPNGSILYFNERIDNYFEKDTETIIYCRGADYVNGKNNGTL